MNGTRAKKKEHLATSEGGLGFRDLGFRCLGFRF